MRTALPLLGSLLLLVACEERAPPAPPAPLEATAGPVAPATAPAPPAPPEGAPKVLEAVRFPAGELAVPSTWRPRVREEATLTSLHVMPALGVTCDLAVLQGHGTKQQAEEYLAAGARAYEGETQRGPDLEVGGHRLQGIVVTRPKAFPEEDDVRVEVYAALSGDDLLSIGVTRLERSEVVDEARASCLGVFAQLTSKMPPAAEVPATAPPDE